MAIKEHTVALTTDGAGAATGYTPHVSGCIQQIRFVNVDMDTPNVAVTLEDTSQALWTESSLSGSKIVLPRQAVQDLVGVDAPYDGSSHYIREPIYCYRDCVKIVVASGGATKSGTFYVVVDG